MIHSIQSNSIKFKFKRFIAIYHLCFRSCVYDLKYIRSWSQMCCGNLTTTQQHQYKKLDLNSSKREEEDQRNRGDRNNKNYVKKMQHLKFLKTVTRESASADWSTLITRINGSASKRQMGINGSALFVTRQILR